MIDYDSLVRDLATGDVHRAVGFETVASGRVRVLLDTGQVVFEDRLELVRS